MHRGFLAAAASSAATAFASISSIHFLRVGDVTARLPACRAMILLAHKLCAGLAAPCSAFSRRWMSASGVERENRGSRDAGDQCRELSAGGRAWRGVLMTRGRAQPPPTGPHPPIWLVSKIVLSARRCVYALFKPSDVRSLRPKNALHRTGRWRRAKFQKSKTFSRDLTLYPPMSSRR